MKGHNSYKPKVNERVLISSPNADNIDGYVYSESNVLWIDDTFILYGNDGFWPVLNKLEHCHIKQLEEQLEEPVDRIKRLADELISDMKKQDKLK